MLITIFDGDDALAYFINPRNIIGAFKDKVSGRYYIDTVDGNQFQVLSESYMRIVDWILAEAMRNR